MASKKKSTNTAVAVSGQFTMDMVPSLLETIDLKIKELKDKFGGDNDQLSNDNLEGFGKVSEINDVPTLIRAISAVRGRENSYKEAIKETPSEITLTKYPFKVNGVGSDAWVICINRQIGKVTYADELKKLEKGRELLKQYVSKEQQFATDMSEFADVFGIKK